MRRRNIVVSYEQDASALLVLLRWEGAEHPATRGNLRHLGFEPNAAPEERSISWRRWITPAELRAVCDRLLETVGADACVLDVGASFADSGLEAMRETRPPPFWRGSVLLHVGGTRWCVVFAGDADERLVAKLFDEGRAQYEEHEFHAATE